MIPVCTPLLSNQETENVLDCLKTNWISSSGKYIKNFEDAFSQYCGRRYGIAVCNGTAALHVAVAALKLGPGDEVIMPTFTIASTAFAVIYAGAKPVFVDSEPGTWNIDPGKIEEKITKRTKAIMPVHIYGHPCEMDKIERLARKYRLKIIEDAAEVHGAEYKGKKAGSFGHLSCFSFYANKIITCGEGGMVLTDDPKLADRCRSLRNLSFLESKRYWHQEVGFNYRMTNLQAAIGLAQFEKIDNMVERRRRNAFIYNSLLSQISGLTLSVERPDCVNVYWMYAVMVNKDFGMTREKLMLKLKEKGIETRTFFIPMHHQPVLKKMGLVSNEKFPVADDIAKRGFYLPSGSGLTLEEIQYVCTAIKEIPQGR